MNFESKPAVWYQARFFFGACCSLYRRKVNRGSVRCQGQHKTRFRRPRSPAILALDVYQGTLRGTGTSGSGAEDVKNGVSDSGGMNSGGGRGADIQDGEIGL